MLILRAPSGASDRLHHVVEVLNGDLEELLEGLDNKAQNQFWEEVEHLEQNREKRAPAIIGEQIREDVRSAVKELDRILSQELRELSQPDVERFWDMLRSAARQQARDTAQPKARHGGGS